MSGKRNLLFAVFFALLATFVAAQDTHFADSPARGLFQRSAWAHGYIHGYEAGFHVGNLDLHMDRSARDPHHLKPYKHADSHYRPAFGDRDDFTHGYGSGFEVGYLDGFRGKEFRADRLAQNLSEEFAPQPIPADRQFDVTLQNAYDTGRKSGLADARLQHDFDPSREKCPSASPALNSCGAFQLGYRWGYSDGFTNQRSEPAPQRASR